MYLKFLHLLLLALILQTSIIDCKKRRNLRKLQLGRSKSSNNSNSNSRKYSSSKSKRANGSSNSRRKSPKPKTLSWLYLANLEDCDQTFLSNQQKMFCQKYPLLFPTIKQAAKDTISSCVSIMSKRKWDCTQLQFEINKFETSNNKNVVSLENSNTNYNVVPELRGIFWFRTATQLELASVNEERSTFGLQFALFVKPIFSSPQQPARNFQKLHLASQNFSSLTIPKLDHFTRPTKFPAQNAQQCPRIKKKHADYTQTRHIRSRFRRSPSRLHPNSPHSSVLQIQQSQILHLRQLQTFRKK